MSQMKQTLEAIMEATQAQDNERFLGFLTDDVEYQFHVGSPGVRGKEGVRKFLSRYRTIAEDVIWRVDRVAESDDCLFIEGYEEYTDKRTGERIAHPYMGIMEFRGDKIAKWRDYFEMNQKVQK
jgi:limonene-1,2-epoxide hydrolase